MSSCVTEILSDRRSRKWSIISQSSRICSCSSDHNGIIHCALLLKGLHQTGDSRSLLAYCHIYTINRLACLIRRTLIEDRIDCDRSLTCLTVTDDELTLTTTDRNHRVYGLETCLQRFCHRLTEYDSRSLSLQRHLAEFSCNLSHSVQRLSKRIHHASHHTFAGIQRSYPACTPDGHSLLDLVCRTQKHCTYIVLLKVHDNCLDAILKLEEFTGFRLFEAMYPDHTVTDLQDRSDLLKAGIVVNVLQLSQQHLRYFAWAYLI